MPGADFSLARAVAASSAFPPVFPPLRLESPEYIPASQVDYVTLTDGGVYDNMGVNPTLRARNALDYLIVSDGGKPFATDAQPTESGAMVLKAALDIMTGKRKTVMRSLPVPLRQISWRSMQRKEPY